MRFWESVLLCQVQHVTGGLWCPFPVLKLKIFLGRKLSLTLLAVLTHTPPLCPVFLRSSHHPALPPPPLLCRDIKPANIFVTSAKSPQKKEEYVVKICDFGLTALRYDKSPSASAPDPSQDSSAAVQLSGGSATSSLKEHTAGSFLSPSPSNHINSREFVWYSDKNSL